MMITEVSPYLEGNFAPIQSEITADHLPIIGELPQELSGIFIRNGPNPQFSPSGRYHWIDGDGMLHGIRIHHGQATYCNRYVQTQGFKIEQDLGRSLWTGLLEAPSAHTPNNLFGPYKNTANTALVHHSRQLLALWEGGEPYRIALPNLETIGPYSYHGQLKSPVTAHPKVDPTTGEMMFFGYSLQEPPYLYYSVVSAQGELIKTIPIDLPNGVMMHDFAITQNYTLFLDLPLTYRPQRVRRKEPAYLFEPDLSSRVGILPRHGDRQSIRWFEVKTCYVLHTLNAYEKGEEIILIACRSSDAQVLNIQSKTSVVPQEETQPHLYRWRFDLRTGEVREEAISDRAAEFPTLNLNRLGKPNQYGYLAKMALGEKAPFTFDGLLKYHLANGRSELHKFGVDRYGGEAVFVLKPQSTVEDEGWLLTFVYDAVQKTSELLIIDAQSLSQQAIARILLPQRVPYGFHGIWIWEDI